jgi:hypothetical protein
VTATVFGSTIELGARDIWRPAQLVEAWTIQVAHHRMAR